MRIVLLLLVVVASWAQEVEMFKLRDGRVLIGTYDAATGIITARNGGLRAEVRVAPDAIVSRAPQIQTAEPTAPPPVISPPPVAAAPAAPTRPAPPAPQPAATHPDPFLVAPEVIEREETEVRACGERALNDPGLSGAQKLRALAKEIMAKLNPFNTAMLLSRRRTDPPVRYRCFAELTLDVPRELVRLKEQNWILTVFDQDGKTFGLLMVARDGAAGAAVERELGKNDFIAIHAWIDRHPHLFADLFVARKLISAGNWMFPEAP